MKRVHSINQQERGGRKICIGKGTKAQKSSVYFGTLQHGYGAKQPSDTADVFV